MVICCFRYEKTVIALYTFKKGIVISSSSIDPLTIIQWPSLSLFTAFVLKSILSGMSIATPAFFWSQFACNTFFQPFTFSLYVSLVLRWVSCKQHIEGSCFCIHLASLCLEFLFFVFRICKWLCMAGVQSKRRRMSRHEEISRILFVTLMLSDFILYVQRII